MSGHAHPSTDADRPEGGQGRDGALGGVGLAGLGAVACAACCAGPVVGFLAAAGVGVVLGAVVFGAVGLTVAVAMVLVFWRRRRARRCDPPLVGTGTVAVEPPRLRSRP